MKNFLVIYHAPAAVIEQMAHTSPEDKAKGMQAWMQWKERTGDLVVSFGSPLGGGQHIDANGAWKNSTNDVSGYSIVQGEDLTSVQAKLVDHPHLAWAPGTSIEVHEYVSM